MLFRSGLKVGLPIYCPVDDEGRLAHTSDLPREQQMPESLLGKSTLEKNHKSEANEAVIEILADRLGISTDAIQIESGHSSPSKIVTITGMDDEAIKKAFEEAAGYAAP